jgi:polysaccharide deacetylase 2 family uncharacterized protein YibQ
MFEAMDRRRFIIKSASMLGAGLLGLSPFSKTMAYERGAVFQRRPQVAIIIDDIGYSRSRARKFLALSAPLTFSILPQLKYSRELAFEIHDHGHEIMLHQPMEPHNLDHYNPGPAALYECYAVEKIVTVMEKNIFAIPYAIGVNNHMGSRFTECPAKINETLKVIRRNALFFIDSRTSGRSIAYKTARQLKMATAARNIFLDNYRSQKYILGQLDKLKKRALMYGHAVGIGHPFPWTAHAIGRFIADPDNSNVALTHVSALLETPQPAFHPVNS